MATRDIYETEFDEDASNNHTTCPECSGHVRTNTAETVCEDCGLVIADQQIDHGPEWRSFDEDEESPERTGAPLTATRHDRGLSTRIGRKRDGNGNQLSGRKQSRLARMRREQSRGQFQSKAERNLAHGLGETQRVASALGLPDSVRDQACQLFRSAQTENLLHGRSIEAVATASVYAACRCNGCSRTLDDVADVARVDQSAVTSAYKALNTDLGLPTKPVTPSEFIPKLASEVECPDSVRQRAQRLATRATEDGVTTGVHPAAFAAACLYKANCEQGRWFTQAEVAEAADTTPTTVRSHRDTLDEFEK
jgi:transcription initiation factor TFIIB